MSPAAAQRAAHAALLACPGLTFLTRVPWTVRALVSVASIKGIVFGARLHAACPASLAGFVGQEIAGLLVAPILLWPMRAAHSTSPQIDPTGDGPSPRKPGSLDASEDLLGHPHWHVP